MGMSNYLENKLLDFMFRAQAYTPPATVYVGLCTGAPSDSSPGTEVTYSGYARVAIVCNLANFSGTQAAGSTSVSTGSSGEISNNNILAFPTPPTNVALPVTHAILMDALTSGNLLFHGQLLDDTDTPVSKTLTAGDPVTYPVGKFRIRMDT